MNDLKQMVLDVIDEFDTEYECLMEGYKQSQLKIEQIGPYDVNTHRMYIKFGCYEDIENVTDL